LAGKKILRKWVEWMKQVEMIRAHVELLTQLLAKFTNTKNVDSSMLRNIVSL
jgi:hypothetical protein